MSASQNTTHGGGSPNRFVTVMRKLYMPLGFKKGYNFPLFVIFAGAMWGFSLARISYLNIGGSAKSSFRNSSAPGEWYYYRAGHYRIGITLHLASVVPLGLLMGWQFIPLIRQKLPIFHRINGYIIIVLTFTGNVGALMIARRSFGGTIETQAGIGILVILTTVSVVMAYVNIKRLQIDQHRAWMLRAMFYLGTIITLRIILICSALIISKINTYSAVQTCDFVDYLLSPSGRSAAMLYPQCAFANATADTEIVVHANMLQPLGPHNVGAALDLSFGMAMWLATIIHLVGVEIYLGLTPRESERLRKVSYERQLEAGFSHPGSSGLTSDRWGDAEEWADAKIGRPDSVVS